MEPKPTNCLGCPAMLNDLYAVLHDTDLSQLDNIRNKRQLSKRQFLFHDGDEPDGVYCVSSGSFRLFKTGSEGDEYIIDLALPGSLLGIRALIANEPYSVSVQAREASTVCFFKAANFRQFLEKKPQASKAIMAQLGRQLRHAREELAERNSASAESRLAHCLLHLEMLYAVWGGRIKVSGQELASMIGVTPETISRMLSRLESSAQIRNQSKEIQILDHKGLALLAGENETEGGKYRAKKKPWPIASFKHREEKPQAQGKSRPCAHNAEDPKASHFREPIA